MNHKRLVVLASALLLFVLCALATDTILLGRQLADSTALPDLAQTFVTVFLGIFIEAAPFLLIGSLASGFVAVFVSQDDMARLIPRNPLLASVTGALIGMIFPVCECGVVPLARRLYQKGLPVSACISLLLGAPVLNPVVIASTYAAFGTGTVFWARLGFTFVIAVGVGAVFINQPAHDIVRGRLLAGGANLRQALASGSMIVEGPPLREPLTAQLQRAFGVASEDFLDMGRYLVMGTLIATALQTFVPQQVLLQIGTNPVTSIIAMIALAYVLSVCSTVDSFLALSFVPTFSTGSIVAFLVFGPMIDIKSTLMFAGLFQRRIVVYLIAMLALCGLVVGLLMT